MRSCGRPCSRSVSNGSRIELTLREWVHSAGWDAGAGASVGVGFTVSLRAAAVTWPVFRTIGLLWQRRRIAALLGGAEPLLDLEFAVVDPKSDHIRGPLDESATVVEYGHFERP
jgi:hypothetical protein